MPADADFRFRRPGNPILRTGFPASPQSTRGLFGARWTQVREDLKSQKGGTDAK